MQDQPAEKALSGGELIIVAIILAILSAILLPQYSKASPTGKPDMPAALREVRSRITAYRRSHDNQLPIAFYDGDQLLPAAIAWDDLGETVANPLNGLSTVAVVSSAPADFADGSDATTPGHGNRSAPFKAGWIVNSTTGRVWATAADATLVFNESTPNAQENYDR